MTIRVFRSRIACYLLHVSVQVSHRSRPRVLALDLRVWERLGPGVLWREIDRRDAVDTREDGPSNT